MDLIRNIIRKTGQTTTRAVPDLLLSKATRCGDVLLLSFCSFLFVCSIGNRFSSKIMRKSKIKKYDGPIVQIRLKLLEYAFMVLLFDPRKARSQCVDQPTTIRGRHISKMEGLVGFNREMRVHERGEQVLEGEISK